MQLKWLCPVQLMVVSDSDSTDIEDNIDNDKMLKNETPDQEDHYDSETGLRLP